METTNITDDHTVAPTAMPQSDADQRSVTIANVDQETATVNIDEQDYATGLRLITIVISLCAGVLLVALDQTIVATAIPKITNEFHAVQDIGWYGSAYFLTAASMTAIWGKIYQKFNIKYWFVGTVAIFELGSLICGVAPNSVTLIVGRAIAGLGVSGIFSGALVIIAYEVPLERRPTYIGMLGGVYGMSSIVGPLIGGGFTQNVTWRWCFYINLPVGAFVVACVLLFVDIKQKPTGESLKERINQVDLYGAAFFIPAIICLLLAVQWGGSTYPWNSSKIIGLFVGFGLLAIIFSVLQVYRGEKAMLPPRILKTRTVWTASLFAMFFTADFFLLTYYIPIYFQSIKGSSAIHSAIQLLPFMLAVIISSISTGALVSSFGRYYFILVGGAVFLIVGTGLITTWQVDTEHAKWIGYQVLMGLGAGGSFQIPLSAIQAALDLKDIPTGTACVAFAQTIGGAIGVGVAQSLFYNNLSKTLAVTLPSIPAEVIIQAGATGFRSIVPEALQPLVIAAYMDGLTSAFRCGLVCACISFIFVVIVPFKGSIRRDTVEGDKEEKVDKEKQLTV